MHLTSHDRAALRATFVEWMTKCRQVARAQPRSAQQAAEQARAVARVLQDRLLEAEAALEVARVQFHTGPVRSVRENLAFALPAFEAAGAQQKVLTCYGLYVNVLVTDSYYASALAVVRRALALDAMPTAYRARFHLAAAIATAGLLDAEAARALLYEHAIPSARACGEREVLLQMLNVVTRFEIMHVCLVRKIPAEFTAGMDPGCAADPADAYLARAAACVVESKRHLVPQDRQGTIWALDAEAWVVMLRDGMDAARPLLDEALALCGDQHGRAVLRVKTTLGMGYRIAGRPEEALPWLVDALQLATTAQEGGTLRSLNFELSLVYEALGRTNDALQALRAYTALQTRKVMNATATFRDPAEENLFGPVPELGLARLGLLRSIEPAYLRRATRLIEEHLHQPIGVAAIAARCGVSVKTLQNAFHRYRGTTPSEATRQLRMERAQAMVRRTSLSMVAIARQLGYSAPSNFTRDFRKHFGVSPTFVRQREATAEADSSSDPTTIVTRAAADAASPRRGWRSRVGTDAPHAEVARRAVKRNPADKPGGAA